MSSKRPSRKILMNVDPDRHDEPEQDLSNQGLGSLAQSARLKHLNSARWLLIAIGVLTILANGYLLATARQQLVDEVRRQNMVIVNQDDFERGLMIVKLIYAV